MISIFQEHNAVNVGQTPDAMDTSAGLSPGQQVTS